MQRMYVLVEHLRGDMDKATSALDSEAEVAIQQSLAEWSAV
ncbi:MULTISPECIES: hypothetical protein [Paenibacillus]|uniref:ABC-type transport system involved in Fe-S cluster assembly fused permease/ATPase subunit n=1 Tax=Paenibacillus peoriae TaxID=59893 RepID=A0ABU1QDW0_9BACL|nr:MULTISPECIES: hypothetical protein [Paenibacillus]MDR6777797.1 ABC-type transport system involved in Fe-S cluster assembly fused permease/ATPase subunit [Paenibacillus peoriae]